MKDKRRDTAYIKSLVRLAAHQTGKQRFNAAQLNVLFRQLEASIGRVWFSAFMIENYLERLLPETPNTDEERRLKEIAKIAKAIARMTAFGDSGDLDLLYRILKEKLGVDE